MKACVVSCSRLTVTPSPSPAPVSPTPSAPVDAVMVLSSPASTSTLLSALTCAPPAMSAVVVPCSTSVASAPAPPATPEIATPAARVEMARLDDACRVTSCACTLPPLSDAVVVSEMSLTATPSPAATVPEPATPTASDSICGLSDAEMSSSSPLPVSVSPLAPALTPLSIRSTAAAPASATSPLPATAPASEPICPVAEAPMSSAPSTCRSEESREACTFCASQLTVTAPPRPALPLSAASPPSAYTCAESCALSSRLPRLAASS